MWPRFSVRYQVKHLVLFLVVWKKIYETSACARTHSISNSVPSRAMYFIVIASQRFSKLPCATSAVPRFKWTDHMIYHVINWLTRGVDVDDVTGAGLDPQLSRGGGGPARDVVPYPHTVLPCKETNVLRVTDVTIPLHTVRPYKQCNVHQVSLR